MITRLIAEARFVVSHAQEHIDRGQRSYVELCRRFLSHWRAAE